MHVFSTYVPYAGPHDEILMKESKKIASIDVGAAVQTSIKQKLYVWGSFHCTSSVLTVLVSFSSPEPVCR